MKQLYIALFILIFCCISKNSQAQLIDTVKITPGYICQIDSFTVDLHLQVAKLGMYPDTIKQLLRNDTLRFKMIYDGSQPGPPLGGTQRIKLRAKTPAVFGNYYLYFENYIFYSTIPTFQTILMNTHTDSFSVCIGAPMSIPENNSKNQLKAQIYPNPTSDVLTIKLPETKGQTVTATLSDVTGKKVLSQLVNSANQTNQIDLKKLPAGIYMLQLQSENSFKMVKVVKQ